jgi:hypothetical protein
LHIAVSTYLQEANVVGDDFVSALGEGRNQRRLARTGIANKRDAAMRNINCGCMQRRNSALMAQRSEYGAEQVCAYLILIRVRCQVHQNFFAGRQKKPANCRKIEQYLPSVVCSAVLYLPVADLCGN